MIATAMLCLLIGTGDPVKITAQVERLAYDPAAFRTMEPTRLKVTEKDRIVEYQGVPLRLLLADQLKGGNAMVNLRDLSDAVILVRASDGYQATISAAEVAMDTKGERYLLAISADGKPLGEGQGPAKLVIPGDPQHVRWVRMIEEISLVRMPRPAKK